MKVKLYIEPALNTLNMIFYDDINGKRKIASPLKFHFNEPKDGDIVEPTFSIPEILSKELLQSLADELFKLGIKPLSQLPLENEMAAVKYHLEDMRNLVFKRPIK